ncbi:MAG: hypothetical protein ACI977_000605 [Candidatus Nanohaloarchaea archaeon]|jgi:uncharacterized protein (TIGR00162 family)
MTTTTTLNLEKQPDVENPTLVEGLAGIGHIGRNVVSYLAEHLDAEKIGELQSDHFPPYTIVKDDKTIEKIKNSIYQLHTDNGDYILVEGNAQAQTPEGHHEVARKLIKFAEENDISRVLTIGGYGTGDVVEDPDVFGAVTTEDLKEDYSDNGIQFEHDVDQIVGVSGLLLGQAQDKEIPGICLLGETPGFLLSDPKSTEAVLKVVESIMNVDLDYSELDDKVEESQEVLKKLQNMKNQQSPDQDQQQSGNDLGYIG